MEQPAPDLPIVALLSETIARYPDEPVNYLLRGEAWLSAGEVTRAAADFEVARGLARRRFAESSWGYAAQAYSDRAEAGLAACGSCVRPTAGGERAASDIRETEDWR